MIDTITTSNLYLKLKENNENGTVLFTAQIYGSFAAADARSLSQTNCDQITEFALFLAENIFFYVYSLHKTYLNNLNLYYWVTQTSFFILHSFDEKFHTYQGWSFTDTFNWIFTRSIFAGTQNGIFPDSTEG